MSDHLKDDGNYKPTETEIIDQELQNKGIPTGARELIGNVVKLLLLARKSDQFIHDIT